MFIVEKLENTEKPKIYHLVIPQIRNKSVEGGDMGIYVYI